MNVVSLFDGMACARVALEKRNIKVEDYFASEIDHDAIKIALKNYPGIKHVGGYRHSLSLIFPTFLG